MTTQPETKSKAASPHLAKQALLVTAIHADDMDLLTGVAQTNFELAHAVADHLTNSPGVVEYHDLTQPASNGHAGSD